MHAGCDRRNPRAKHGHIAGTGHVLNTTQTSLVYRFPINDLIVIVNAFSENHGIDAN